MRTILVFMSALCIAFAVSCSKKAENPNAAVSFFIGDVTRNGSPVNIGSPPNSADGEGDTFVSPDQKYLILTSTRADGPPFFVQAGLNETISP